eukprot:1613585-Amphidinium_carterae.1
MPLRGHVFDPDDGAKRTNQRHCINDSSIQYVVHDPPAEVLLKKRHPKMSTPQTENGRATSTRGMHALENKTLEQHEYCRQNHAGGRIPIRPSKP